MYSLQSDFCILVMESGASVTIADAMSYLGLDIKVVPEKPEDEKANETEKEETEEEEPKAEVENQFEDDPNLPKVTTVNLYMEKY
jgi:cysteine synthase